MLSNWLLEMIASRRLDNKRRARESLGPGHMGWLLWARKGAGKTLGSMGEITSY